MQFKKLAALVLSCCVLASCAGRGAGSDTTSPTPSDSVKNDFTAVPTPDASAPAHPQPPAAKGAYQAMWVSYLEWKALDTTGEAAFTQSVGTLLDNCKDIGLNRVIVQVRPFADAIYKTDKFPWSHIITGVQGKDPGYDPFAIFVSEAHARGLAIEAWFNPYRIRLNGKTPETLADNSIATQHPEWVKTVGDGMYLNPASAAVRAYIIDGVCEVVQNYDIDGVQFDDYFYPTTNADFDAAEFAAEGKGKTLAEWRRENVNTLVKETYAAIKALRPELVFGISPQGNNDNNYNEQYSDVRLWLQTPGYVDYVMPQLYWGFEYLTKSGRTDFQFAKLVQDWSAYPRHSSVSLHIGLGAYRIGIGDGGANDQSEWQSGENLAKQIKLLQSADGVHGFSLYRYDNLFNAGEYAAKAQQEAAAIKAALLP
ncbi:MAG: family 10 glycosylhydrolase [Oscillospiraceae bacterium]|nr:family 10 glycosylhydrolase [Oscillospiraceae bacterium]